jgi:hypothetical protein
MSQKDRDAITRRQALGAAIGGAAAVALGGCAISLAAPAREGRLAQWSKAPSARQAHPREEHLLPLMVIAGAAGDDAGRTAYRGTLLGLRLSAYHFGQG